MGPYNAMEGEIVEGICQSSAITAPSAGIVTSSRKRCGCGPTAASDGDGGWEDSGCGDDGCEAADVRRPGGRGSGGGGDDGDDGGGGTTIPDEVVVVVVVAVGPRCM